MIIVGPLIGVFGIGLFCWLLFSLAVYALPFFAGVTAGFAAFYGGAGVVGAIFAAVLAGIATLVAGQVAFAATRSLLVRAAIALVFASPAAVAGYHATLGLARISAPSEAWSQLFAIIGALLVGGTTWGRMTLLARPLGTATASQPGSAERLEAAASPQ
jgi:hypothetical protein